MTYCPSQDWDRYIGEKDEAAEAEMAFYAEHRADILKVVCALLAGGRHPMEKNLISDAAEIVRDLDYRAFGECE